jgi:hypothetical protein
MRISSPVLQWGVNNRKGVNEMPAWKGFMLDLKAIATSRVRLSFIYLYSSWVTKQLDGDGVGWLKLLQQVSMKLSGVPFSRWIWSKRSTLPYSLLSFLSDKSGKTRIVAIGDVWSQLVLKPFHDIAFDFLRILPTDGTHNQDKQRERVKQWSERNKLLYCFDLTAATDRMPVILQAWVFYQSGVIDNFFSMICWYRLIARRDFQFSPIRGRTHPNEGKTVRYAVGQPMGLYSSWAALALTHHCLVWYAAHKAGHKSPFRFRDYSLCGDDIVIANQKVALQYQILCKMIGVEINLSKSYVGYGIAEYMKTLYVKGSIMSTLPLESLKLRSAYYIEDVMILLEHLYDRRIYLTLEDFLDFLPKHRVNEVYAAITCPSNRIFYNTLLWEISLEHKYCSGYLAFRRTIRRLLSVDLKSVTSIHVLVGDDPIKTNKLSPYIQKAMSMSNSVSQVGSLTLRKDLRFAIGHGFVVYWSSEDFDIGLLSPHFNPLLEKRVSRKETKLANMRKSMNAHDKVRFAFSLGLGDTDTQAWDYFVSKTLLPSRRQ